MCDDEAVPVRLKLGVPVRDFEAVPVCDVEDVSVLVTLTLLVAAVLPVHVLLAVLDRLEVVEPAHEVGTGYCAT